VYQYSDEVNWKSPHYEKIMSIQTTYVRTYALAYSLLGRESYLQWAKSIHDYLTQFLMNEAGVFYTSQDADLDADTEGKAYFSLSSDQRQRLGTPPIDTNIYARENGWVISALTALYGATGDGDYLNQARRAAEWIVKHRGLGGGGFRHGESATDTPFLGDTLAMGRALLDLYAVTGERPWLARAEAAAGFIDQHFLDAEGGGFATSAQSQQTAGLPVGARHLDSNIRMARFGNLLSHYTGKDRYRELAHHAMRYLVSPDVTDQRRLLGGVLLADWELNQQPVHVTVVGQKDDSDARQLFAAALRYGNSYKRLEWWDRREGALPNPDVLYPKVKKAAAYVCTNKTCSAPVFESEQVLAAIDRLSRL
jgi:uncharacterized protein YyaL (SSP411 family)